MHLLDLMNLHDLPRYLSYRQFSKMALDQVHEQNNEKITEASEATHSLNRNDMGGIKNFESHTGLDFDASEKPHY